MLISANESEEHCYFEVHGLAARFFEILVDANRPDSDFSSEVQKIATECGISEARVNQDLENFLNDLKTNKIIE